MQDTVKNPQRPATDTSLYMITAGRSLCDCPLLWFHPSGFSEPDPADLQLWHREPDPIPQLRSGQPHEVWHQRKDAAIWQFFPFSSS